MWELSLRQWRGFQESFPRKRNSCPQKIGIVQMCTDANPWQLEIIIWTVSGTSCKSQFWALSFAFGAHGCIEVVRWDGHLAWACPGTAWCRRPSVTLAGIPERLIDWMANWLQQNQRLLWMLAVSVTGRSHLFKDSRDHLWLLARKCACGSQEVLTKTFACHTFLRFAFGAKDRETASGAAREKCNQCG